MGAQIQRNKETWTLLPWERKREWVSERVSEWARAVVVFSRTKMYKYTGCGLLQTKQIICPCQAMTPKRTFASCVESLRIWDKQSDTYTLHIHTHTHPHVHVDVDAHAPARARVITYTRIQSNQIHNCPVALPHRNASILFTLRHKNGTSLHQWIYRSPCEMGKC